MTVQAHVSTKASQGTVNVLEGLWRLDAMFKSVAQQRCCV
jgi:hypothetical protein